MITVTSDTMGRGIPVIPNTDAARLQAAITDGWTEFPGIAHGYSPRFPPGTWVYRVTADILAAITLCGSTGRVCSKAARGAFYGVIVGHSGWNPENRWWADCETARHVHVTTYPCLEHGALVYTG